MKKHRKQPLPPITSARKLATLMQRSHVAVSKWLKRADWPFGTPPWLASQLPSIAKWSDETLRPSVDAGNEDAAAVDLRRQKLRQEIRRLNAQADASECAFAKERGSLMDAGEVVREWQSITAALTAGVGSLPESAAMLALSHGMPHEARGTFKQQVREAIDAILQRMNARSVVEQ